MQKIPESGKKIQTTSRLSVFNKKYPETRRYYNNYTLMNNSYLVFVFFNLFYLIAIAKQPFRKKFNPGNTKTQDINSPGYRQPTNTGTLSCYV